MDAEDDSQHTGTPTMKREKNLGEQGCPWNWRVLESARIAGHSHVLKWAEENGMG